MNTDRVNFICHQKKTESETRRHRGKETETRRQRQGDRDTEKKTRRQRHRDRDTETETQRQRHRDRDTETEAQRQRHRDRDTETYKLYRDRTVSLLAFTGGSADSGRPLASSVVACLRGGMLFWSSRWQSNAALVPIATCRDVRLEQQNRERQISRALTLPDTAAGRSARHERCPVS